MVGIGGASFPIRRYVIMVIFCGMNDHAIAWAVNGVIEYFIIFQPGGEYVIRPVAYMVQFYNVHGIYSALQAIMKDISRQPFTSLENKISTVLKRKFEVGNTVWPAGCSGKIEYGERAQYNG